MTKNVKQCVYLMNTLRKKKCVDSAMPNIGALAVSDFVPRFLITRSNIFIC